MDGRSIWFWHIGTKAAVEVWVMRNWKEKQEATDKESQEERYRVDRNNVSLPSHRWANGWQPLKNIITNGWLTENH